MYCKYCGKELSDSRELLFCTNCGKEITKGDTSENVDKKSDVNNIVDNFKKEFILSIKFMGKVINKPYNSIKNSISNLTLRDTFLTYGLCTIIISFITLISVNILKGKIIEFQLFLNNNSMNIEERLAFQNILNRIIPSFKIFLWTILAIGITYLVILTLSYLIFSVILKKNIKFSEYAKSTVVGILFHTFLMLLLFIMIIIEFSFKMILPFIILFILFHLFVVYECISTVIKDRDKSLYIYPVIYCVSNVSLGYLMFNLILNHIFTLQYLNKDLLNLLDIIDKIL